MLFIRKINVKFNIVKPLTENLLQEIYTIYKKVILCCEVQIEKQDQS